MSTEMQKTNGNGNGTALVEKPIENLKRLFELAAPKLAKVLPQHLTAGRLTQVALACITRTPKLLKCTPTSLLQAVMQCAEMGLEPGSVLGEVALVPFGDQVTVIPMYRGLVSLARRSGAVTDIESAVVREGDKFRYERGIKLVLKHKPLLEGDQDRKIVAVYMVAHLKGTTRPHVEVMSAGDVDRIRARSRSAHDGPWVTDYAEMARKTVVRRGIKMLPMSVHMARAMEIDDEDFSGDDSPGPVIDVTASVEQAESSFKRKVKEKAARAPELAATPGIIESSFLTRDEPPVAAPAPAPAPIATSSPTTSPSEPEPPPPPKPRTLTPEEREAEQAEIALAAADKARREAEAAKVAAERAAFLRVPPPKKPKAPVGPGEVDLGEFKLTAPAAGAAPVERVTGEDDEP